MTWFDQGFDYCVTRVTGRASSGQIVGGWECRPEHRQLIFSVSCTVVTVNAFAMVRGLLRTSNLPQLQNLIKRDPVSYKEEFLQQWNHYNSTRQIFQINPAEQASHFRELVTFISQVRICLCTVCGPNLSV